jgi:hypothetical protein
MGKVAVIKCGYRKHPDCIGKKEHEYASPSERSEEDQQGTQVNEDVRYATKPLHSVLSGIRFIMGLRGRADPLGKGGNHELRSIVQDERKL